MEEHASTQAKTGVDTTKQPQQPASPPVVPPEPTGPAVDPDAIVVAPKPKRGGHLHQIDLVRLVTFAAVIFDHVILGLMSAGAVVAGGIGLLCRYTRYSFFALTGFVQTYQYRNRELKPVEYWRRRYKLIGLPFLMWSLFYWAYTRYRRGGISNVIDNFTSFDALGTALKSIAYDLITGHAFYHMYFMSVSMQIYLVFPAVLWVLKRTWGYHRYLLAISFVFHAWLIWRMMLPPLGIFSDGVGGKLWSHLTITLLPYQFFILCGCIAAMHLEAFQAFMIRWRAQLIAAGLVVVAGTLWWYTVAYHGGRGNVGNGPDFDRMFRATNVFSIYNIGAFIAIIVIRYCLGTIWQQRRSHGSLADRFMSKAADRSYGIYLAHALALAELMRFLREHPGGPFWPKVIATYVVTCLLTVFVVETLRRSPISLITTGRNMISWKEQNEVKMAGGAVVAVVLGIVLRYGFEMLVGQLITGTGLLLAISAGVVAYQRRRAAIEEGATV